MPDIGIVGAGTAGLHLALLLQQRGLEPTLYAERTAAELREGRLPNTVAHHHHTRAREQELGVNHWDDSGPRTAATTTTSTSSRRSSSPATSPIRASPSTTASTCRRCWRTSSSAEGRSSSVR